MQDCHAHAFPTVGESLSHASPVAADLAKRVGARVTRSLRRALPTSLTDRVAGGLSSLLEKGPVDVESLARLRRRSELAHKLEPLMSVGLLPQVLTHCSIDHLLQSMERHGISRTVLIAAQPIASNAWTLEQSRLHPTKLVPVVNMPSLPEGATDADWTSALDKLAADGARGFKIHLNMDGLGHAHRAYRAAFEVARARSLFVIVHTGCFHAPRLQDAGRRRAGPLRAPLPRRFLPRTVRVCPAHMNRGRASERAREMQRKHAQLFCDTSWQPAERVAEAVRAIGSDRIVLGLDWPLLHPDLQGTCSRSFERRSAPRRWRRSVRRTRRRSSTAEAPRAQSLSSPL